MYVDIDVYDTQPVDLKLDFDFQEKFEDFILEAIRNQKKDESYNEALEKVLEILKDAPHDSEIYNIDAYIDSVKVDDDDLPNNNNGWDDGYEAAQEKHIDMLSRFKLMNSTLFTKLENKVYHFGNHQQDAITNDDYKVILDFFEAKLYD